MSDRMEALVASFPSLEGAPGASPWDAERFLAWLCTQGLSHGEFLAARFVLSVWNPTTDWAELARMEYALPYAAHAARFDFHEAFGVWDEKHREAFLAWAERPWWP